MKRSPLVIAGTAAGLAGVLSFHSVPAQLTLGAVSTTAGTSSTTSSTSSTSAPTTTTSRVTSSGQRQPGPTSTVASAGGRPPTTTKTTSPPTTTVPAPTTTTVASGSRTATGPLVNYYFGELSVTVKATGSKITSVTVGKLNDGGNYRSQSIDSQSIPMLEQEAMQAQSGTIQSISGASYTSAGFAQSLQGALKQLGL